MRFNESDIHVYGTATGFPTTRVCRVLEEEGVTFWFIDVDQDPRSAALVRELNGGACRLPTVLCPDGAVLVQPDDRLLRQKVAVLQGPAPPTADYSYGIL